MVSAPALRGPELHAGIGEDTPHGLGVDAGLPSNGIAITAGKIRGDHLLIRHGALYGAIGRRRFTSHARSHGTYRGGVWFPSLCARQCQMVSVANLLAENAGMKHKCMFVAVQQ